MEAEAASEAPGGVDARLFNPSCTAVVLQARVPRRNQLELPSRDTGTLEQMGLLEILIIILVLAAIFGGIAVSPVLFVLLIVVLVILFTRGGFGYQRGSRG